MKGMPERVYGRSLWLRGGQVKQMLMVTAAVIQENGKILICQRGAGGNCAFCGSFPVESWNHVNQRRMPYPGMRRGVGHPNNRRKRIC